MRVVAVISVFTIITATVFPVYAAEDDDIEFFDNKGKVVFTVPADEFSNDDYIIPYDLYLELKNSPISTYNAATGVLGYSGGLAWSSEFAAKGLTCASGGLYFLAYALAGGMVVTGVDGLIDMYRNGEFEQFYADVCTLYNNVSADTKAWLETAFTSYVNGTDIDVPVEASRDIASVLNGGFTSDGAGNVIDTSIAIPEAGIGGMMSETFSNFRRDDISTEFTGINMTDLQTLGTMTVETGYIAWTLNHTVGYDVYSPATMTNKITGSSLTIDTNAVRRYCRGLIEHISKFYYVEVADGGSHWIVGLSDNSTNWFYPFAFTLISANSPAIFKDTGTILDDVTITSVTWDAVAKSWLYKGIDFPGTWLPVDPIGLLLSNTGSDVVVGGGTAVANPGNKNIKVPPPPPFVPDAGPVVGGGTVGIPLTDDVLSNAKSDVNSNADTKVDADVLEADEVLEFDGLASIKAFLGGLGDFFTGLFSWLPDDFERKLDGVWITLGVIILIIIPYRFIT